MAEPDARGRAGGQGRRACRLDSFTGSERWRDVQRVLRAVLDVCPQERAAAVAAACQDDTALRRDVESLLAHEVPAATFLERPVFPTQEAEHEVLAGSRVGPYRLQRLLGVGGMGEVWLAERDDEQYRKQVAIKLVKAGMDTEDVVDRFCTERQVLARLEHPHIARLLDGGATGQGRPYLVMEYVEGTPILGYCDGNGLTIKRRLELFRKVCGAVEYAHRNLVVHRDLKPSNILVTADGEPKLLDFGIANALDPAATDPGGGRPAVGQCLTLRYASPEQVRGEPITTASDVYSLGVILYELLTGRGPYALSSHSRAEYEHAICSQEPVRPSATPATPPGGQRAGGTGRRVLDHRRLRGDLDAVLLKALRKEPGSRYSSAEQLSLDLERYLRGLAVVARANSLRYRLTKLVRRHALGVASAVTLLAVLVGGIVATARQARFAAHERNLAIEAGDRARAAAREAALAARKAERVTRFLQSVLTTANPQRARRGISAEEALDRAAASVAEDFRQDPEVEAAVHDAVGLTYLDLGKHGEAERHLRAAVAIHERIRPGESLALAGSLRNLGKLQHARAEFAAARRSTERALAMDRHLHEGMHEETATDLNNLAAIARAQGDFAQAARFLDEALAMRRALFGEEHALVAQSLNNQVALLRAQGELEAAEHLARRVLEIRRRLLGDSHPDTVQSLDNLAVLLASRRDYAAAEPLMREAVARFREALGEEHPDLAVALGNLGRVLSARGNHAEAEGLFREALAIRRRVLAAGDERTVRAARQLAQCLVELHLFESAEQVLREAIAEARQALGDHHEITATLGRELGRLHDARNQAGEAAELRGRLPPANGSAGAGEGAQEKKN